MSKPNWHALTYMPEELPPDPRWFTQDHQRKTCESRTKCSTCMQDTFCSYCATTMKCLYTPTDPSFSLDQRKKLLYEPDTGTNSTPGHCPGPDDEKPEKHGQCSKLWRAHFPLAQRHLWKKVCKALSPVAGYVKKKVEVLPGQFVEAEYPVDEDGEPVPLEVAEAAGQPTTGNALKEMRGTDKKKGKDSCVPRQVLDRQQMLRMKKFKMENSFPPAGGILQEKEYSVATVEPHRVAGLTIPDWKIEGAIDAYRPEGLGSAGPYEFRMADETWQQWMADPKHADLEVPNGIDPAIHPTTKYYTEQKGDISEKGNTRTRGYQHNSFAKAEKLELDREPWLTNPDSEAPPIKLKPNEQPWYVQDEQSVNWVDPQPEKPEDPTIN